MEPKILNRDSFTVMGTMTRVTPEKESNEHYELIWKTFESYHHQVRPHSSDQAYYGVSFPTGEEGVYDYAAGMAVGKVENVPEDLVIREVPAARYAVFECPVRAIGDTYQYIFSDWLRRSTHEINSSAPVFEQYPPEGGEKSPVLIHVPIKEKNV